MNIIEKEILKIIKFLQSFIQLRCQKDLAEERNAYFF